MGPDPRTAGTKHAQILDLLKKDLLIIFLMRLGGSIDLTVKEVDTLPVHKGLAMSLNNGVFHFEIQDVAPLKVR